MQQIQSRLSYERCRTSYWRHGSEKIVVDFEGTPLHGRKYRSHQNGADEAIKDTHESRVGGEEWGSA